MSKPILFKDGQNSYILPISHANLIQTSTGISVEEKFNTLSQSSKLSFYTSDDCSVDIYAKDDTLNGDYSGKTPIKTWNYTANTQVSLDINLDEHFEINNPNDSIKVIYSWPGVCEKFYDWFMSVNMFCNMIFNFNKMEHTSWEHNSISGGVKEAQYRNCVFWWDVAMTDVNVHCYTLHKTQECPLFYSTIPENTYKTLVEPYNIANNPNFTNEAFLNSMALSDCRSALSYSHTRSVPFGCFEDANVVTNIIKINGDCRTFMAWSGAEDTATFDCETVTNFGYRLSGGYMYWNAFYECKNLKNLMLKNLKISVNLSWSPISQYSLNYIINNAANESAITIALSPYTWYNLTDSIKTVAANKNITLILGSLSNNADLKIWQDVEGIRNSYLSADNLDLTSYVSKTELNAAGYLTSFTETDPTVPSYVKEITETDITNWNNKLSEHQDLSSYVKWDEKSLVAPNTDTLSMNRLYIEASSDPQIPLNGRICFININRCFDGSSICDYLSGYGDDVKYSFTRNVKGDVAITKDITDAINSYVISASYLTSESDPTVPSYVKSITEQNITDWNNKLSTHQDLSAYVSKTELDLAGYITNLSPRIVEFDENEWAFGGKLITGDGFIDPSTSYVLMADDGELRMYKPGAQTFWKIPFTNDFESGRIVAFQDQIPSLTSYATSANYDSNTKKIYLKHGSTTLSEIDATDFIKDGMVETAYVQGSNLVISFNTDAGKQPVNIPLTDIFNANNYYTKSEINNAGYLQSFTETDPIFTASVAAGIKSTDITNWNSKTSNIGTITGVSMNNTVMGTSGVVNLGTVLTEHQDLSSYVKISDLNAAGYLQSFTETDPTVPSHVKSITEQNITDWNNKLDSFTETDPTVPSHVKSITQQNILDWNTTNTNSHTHSNKTVIDGIKASDIDNWNSYANIQSDWGETDNTKSSYILNKPKITVSSNFNGTYATHLKVSTIELESWSPGGVTNVGPYINLGDGLYLHGNTISDDEGGMYDDVNYRFDRNVTDSVAVLSDLNSYLKSDTLNTTLSSYATSANYDSNTKKIYLKHGTTTLSEIDATNFIKDGMVETAYVQGTNLVISFNTDAGKEAVNVPIADIFNPNNYYTKSQIDTNVIHLTGDPNFNGEGTVTCAWEVPNGIPSNYTNILQAKIENYASEALAHEDNYYCFEAISNLFPSGGTTDVFTISRKMYKALNTAATEFDEEIGIGFYPINPTSYAAIHDYMNYTETDPTVPDHVKSITEQNISDWNNKLSSETQLSKGTTTGSGNAVTDISVSNHQITLTKGSTFLTSHQDIKTINNQTITGTGNVTINELPTVSSSDNGKVLQVVNGQWQLVTPLNLYSGTGAPDNSQGNNGDLYMQI